VHDLAPDVAPEEHDDAVGYRGHEAERRRVSLRPRRDPPGEAARDLGGGPRRRGVEQVVGPVVVLADHEDDGVAEAGHEALAALDADHEEARGGHRCSPRFVDDHGRQTQDGL
jgi:hypothetical protein